MANPIASTDPRWKVAGRYNSTIAAVAEAVDEVTAPLAHAHKILGLIEKLRHELDSDEEWKNSEQAKGGWGLNLHAPKQRLDDLQNAAEATIKAMNELNRVYDEMNGSFLRLGIK